MKSGSIVGMVGMERDITLVIRGPSSCETLWSMASFGNIRLLLLRQEIGRRFRGCLTSR